MIRNSERQKADEIRLKEAILYSEFFPRKKLIPKVGSMLHALKQQKRGEGDIPRGNQSISGRNTAAGAKGGHSSAAFRPQVK